MQGNIGKRWIQHAIITSLEKSGFQVQIDQIEGILPEQIDLKGIRLKNEETNIYIAELKLRPVLWRLLKAEAAFKEIQGRGISIDEGAPFDLNDGKVRIDRKRIFARGEIDRWSLFARYHFKTKRGEFSALDGFWSIRGSGDLSPKFNLDIGVRSPLLTMSINVTETMRRYYAKSVWILSRLDWMGPVEGNATAIYENKKIKGTISASHFAKGEFELSLNQKGVLGKGKVNIDNLQSLHIKDAYGKASLKTILDKNGLHIDAILEDFYYKDLYAKNLSVYSDYSKNEYDFQGESLKWKSLEIQNGSIIFQNGNYKLFVEGNLKHPFELYADGNWENPSLLLDNLHGKFIDSPFILNEPIEIVYKENEFILPNTHIQVGDGNAFFSLKKIGKETIGKIELKEIPLDFLSFNPFEIPVEGTINLNGSIHEKNNHLSGKFNAKIAQSSPLNATADLEASLNKDQLSIKGNVLTQTSPLLQLDLTLPVHLTLWPFDAKLLFHKKVKGNIAVDSNVGEILDYFDLGSHRLSGHLFGQFDFSHTLYRPLVKGNLRFKNGSYENYYTGTELTQIEAEIIAEKNDLILSSFSAVDRPTSGKLDAAGKLQLLQSALYPFKIDVSIDRLLFSEIDLVSATATGKLLIEGNALSAIAKGDIYLENATLTIPDHIARPLPDLEVSYKNAIHPVEAITKKSSPYPLNLDLNIKAPAKITISGRGLESEWRGDFHLGGTYTELAAKGKLELIEGEFKFSSKSFQLTEGSLTFTGKEHQMPLLNLAAQNETKGILITARLKGPLDNPQLTLLSNPPLPLGSIMSYLLFGQDISEIGSFQALQIATSLASFAGTGPDVMESTRKTLGVDQLRVVSEPNEEGGETIALQVGKYITKGVLVTYTQGPDESSTNISVEIELKRNLLFQIESDQRQEQGKFTLKWNLNY